MDDGMLDLCIIIAALGEHEDIPRSMGAEVLFHVSMSEGSDDEVMFGLIGESMFSAIPLAVEGYGLERDQDVMEDQDAISPLMPDDNPFAMIEFLGVFRMPTGTMLKGTLKQKRNLPGQRLLGQVVERRGKLFRLLLGEVL
jgi:hypothetical protein